jgi:trehalose synthase
LRALAEPLAGARVLHLNATPYGGGVAEILRSEVPLLRDLGLSADWKIVTGDKEFFSVTKTMHNALQGARRTLTDHEREIYLTYSTRNARLLEEEYDLIVAHDPQPLAMPQFHGRAGARWIWRCHIDTSEPNPELWGFLRPYLDDYDAAVFTLEDFVPPAFPVGRVEVIPPAIDPESPKNIEIPSKIALRLLGWLGVELGKPLLTQVSRFDPWKDQPGVIEAYRMVKEEVGDLKLALVGSMALDDPEGWEVYRQIKDAARKDPDIDIFTNLTGVSNVEVNAFQRFSDVCVQKSIREGFGLVVSETLWKETPVVAGEAGGIPLQMRGGAGGFLVGSVEECAEKVLHLLRNPEEGEELALWGKELVRERFLLTRLIADELVLYASLLGAGSQPGPGAAPEIRS